MELINPTVGKSVSLYHRNLPEGFTSPRDAVGMRLLKEYGAMFVAQGVRVPHEAVFRDESEVANFQFETPQMSAVLGGETLKLQKQAMRSLLQAAADLQKRGLEMNPRGPDSASRSYNDTVELWRSRVEPALDHWLAKGRISRETAIRIREMSPFDQVHEVLTLEDDGIFFAKDLSKSILYSVAPPGASQHLAMLAFDVREFDEPEVRDTLAEHGWFQTVTSDLPHFTYLGLSKEELPSLGLKEVENAGRTFWVPDI